MAFKIEIGDSQRGFQGEFPAAEPKWFDTSYQNGRSPIGRLRMPSVSNGRYEAKHPIFDASGENVGFFVEGATSLGYTYCCVYADPAGCFYVSHVPYREVWGGGNRNSYISTISAAGSFWFRPNVMKFRQTETFSLPSSWVGSELAFKLLDEGHRLLFLARQGFCFVDTIARRVVSKTAFERESSISGFALSPKVHLLAACFSVPDHLDPLDGEYRYRNLVQIYDLDTGELAGERQIGDDHTRRWRVAFGPDGRQLAVRTDGIELAFDLETER